MMSRSCSVKGSSGGKNGSTNGEELGTGSDTVHVDLEVSEFHVNVGVNDGLGHASIIDVLGTGGGVVENGVDAAHGFLSGVVAFLSRGARWKDGTVGVL